MSASPMSEGVSSESVSTFQAVPAVRTGGEILVAALRYHGVRRVFTVPRDGFADALDAAGDAPDLKIIVCRHEGGASFMAEAAGKLTGGPGVCFVGGGPGACNAAVGAHAARQSAAPMVLLVALPPGGDRHRDAFQDIDLRAAFGGTAKWVADVDSPGRIPEMVARAFHVAVSGRPGPVVLGLPEDVLAARSDAPDSPPNPPARPFPDPALIAALGEALRGACKPLVLAGGGGWTDEACADLRRFAEANRLPVCAALHQLDVFDNESDCWAGDLGFDADPKLTARLRDCDFLIVVGARIDDAATKGFTVLEKPTPRQALAHIHPCAEELGRVFRPDLAIQADVAAAAAALAALEPVADPPWTAWTAEANADRIARAAAPASCDEPDAGAGAGAGPPEADDAVFKDAPDVGRALDWLRDRIPANAVVVVDAGRSAGPPQRRLLFRRPGRLFGPANGAAGCGLPAAVAAKIVEPRRPVFCFVGGDGFATALPELATARLYGATPMIFVVDDRAGENGAGENGTGENGTGENGARRRRGTPRPASPDFAALAQAYGCFGATAAPGEEFIQAFWDGLWSGLPAVVHLKAAPRRNPADETASSDAAGA